MRRAPPTCPRFSSGHHRGSFCPRSTRTCRARTARPGYCSFADEVQEADCNTQRCCYNSPWTAFGPCSTTCGAGFQTRTINDCDGLVVRSERQMCSNEVPFTLWTEWTGCSVSCGTGLKTRTRSNACTGTEEQTARCFAGDCPYWENWSMWSFCSVTCGEGDKTR